MPKSTEPVPAKPDQRLIEASFMTLVLIVVGVWLMPFFLAFEAAIISLLLTALGLPLFRRYALARPNARSSHSVPIPQGGGLAIVIAVLIIFALHGKPLMSGAMPWVGAGILLLAAIGAVDDILTLPVLPRLSGQLLAVAMAVHGLAAGGQLFPLLPFGLEFILLVIAGAWFVNLTNFMDGIDGITLAAFLLLAAGVLLLGQWGGLSFQMSMLAIAFFGALTGFVLFNYPRAKIFMGDVGSLPIGLIGGVLLLDIAQRGAFAAAVILPLYHFTDATLTLALRLMRREKVWEAHRQHAYQHAVDGGWSHKRVSGIVLLLNCGLVGLALLTVGKGFIAQTGIIAVAFLAVMAVIWLFRSRKRVP